jgi:hypothetical protein
MRGFQSSIIFNLARKKLPPGTVQAIFSRSTRLVDYWSADPRTCEETRRNPLDRVRMLLDELDSAGYGDYARAAIDYMAEPLGGRFCDTSPAASDKGTVAGEVMDATICLGQLAGTIETALSDRCLSDREKIEIKGAARRLVVQIEQLLDVVGVCKP